MLNYFWRMNFETAKNYILHKLQKELDPRLTYHSIGHTLDVLESAERIAEMENIPAHETELLSLACLYHDSGMLITYRGHEEASIHIVKETLPGFGYSPGDIDLVNQMIQSTKLPQSATAHLNKILCDADLDYLGRNDYHMIAHRLKYEWEVLDIKTTTLTEWYQIQKEFLSNHRYFTASAIQLRESGKQENLRQILHILNNEK